MNDCIRREDAIAEICKARTPDVVSHHYAELFINAVCRAPSVDRPQGEWIVRFPYEDTGKTRMCSNCNMTQTVNVYDGVVRFKFCPYCGAKMKGADDERQTT